MTKQILVKICGISTTETLKAVCSAGANFVGFVFYPSSKRFVAPDQAKKLIEQVSVSTKSVGLFVNPTDYDLKKIMDLAPLNIIQLHGDETPQRVEKIKTITNLPIIKALLVKTHHDVKIAEKYEDVIDWLLFDTKSPTGQYGGMGQSFDWNLLKNYNFKVPWMLSGGLNTENIKDALKLLSPTAVDVSSGVENEHGVKDSQKIKAFIQAVKTL